MAKNFTEFQEVTGTWSGGVTTTQATGDMYLVGYDTDTPGGERRYTIESVLLAASPYHVGLENVVNESKTQMFNNSNLTGSTTAAELIISGDLFVEGNTVELNTESIATSAFNINNTGTTDALRVVQENAGTIYNVAQFLYGSDIAMEINSNGNVGIKTQASDDPNLALSIIGNISASGEIFVGGEVDGRHVSQDGAKLDDIEYYADVTSIALSSVSQRLGELSSTPNLSGIAVQKGFDLLEDGDTFTKTPATSSIAAPGLGDYSIDKLKSVEYHADKTGDHSADIILNDVPNGPWTGDANTTYVKVTSAEHDRLTTVRGVSASLYNLDDGGDIDRDDIRKAYQQAYPDFWSSANEAEYRSTIVPAATGAVHNTNETPLPAGEADLTTLNVTQSATIQNATLGSTVSVLSGGSPVQGLTQSIDVGGWILHYVDGILVDAELG